MSRFLFPVLVLAAVAATGAALAQTVPATAEIQREQPAKAATILSKADRETLLLGAERLKGAQAMGVANPNAAKAHAAAGRAVAVKATAVEHSVFDKEISATENEDKARLEAATHGTSRILLYFAQREDLRLASGQRDVLFQAMVETEAVQKEAARRDVQMTDVERARQAERQVVLAYWDNPEQEVKKADVLSPHQMGYAFEQRFKTLNEALNGHGATAGVETAELARIYQEGADRAAALSRLTAVASTPGMDGLLESFDRLSRRALQGSVTPDVAINLQAANDDLGQQLKLHSLGLPAVKLTVRAIRQASTGKTEVPGYNVRYELEGNDFLETPQGNSFSGTTTVTDQLGPYHYVFWAESMGQPASAKKKVNLGNPLVASREIEIPLLGPEASP